MNDELLCIEEFTALIQGLEAKDIEWPEDDTNPDDDGTDGDDMNPDDDGTDGDDMNPDDDGDDMNPDGDEHEHDGENAVATQDAFDEWVAEQEVGETPYYCSFDIQNHWHNGYFLWAGHDCEIYDLTLKLYVPKDAWQNRRTWTSSDSNQIGEAECSETSEDCVVMFFITPMNPKLGLGFNAEGDPVNVRFETESWTDCVDNMEVE